jgi:diacylglycerol O-acyltransferase
MLASLCDPVDADVAPEDSAGGAVSSNASFAVAEAGRSLAPAGAVRAAWRTMTSIVTTTGRVVSGTAQLVAGLAEPTRTELTGPLGDLRRIATARVAMRDVRLVCRRFDVTVNDVALAAICDGFRTTMTRRGVPLRAGSMRTLVPVSVRSADAMHVPDNRVSLLLPELPVDRSDPIERLRLVHERLSAAKGSSQRQAASLVVAAANLVPYPIMSATVRLVARIPQHSVVTVATNVPGPSRRVRFMDREVSEVIPVPPIALGLRTGIAITSYADHLRFGVIGDYDSRLGAEELARGIEDGMERLAIIAKAARSSRRRGALLLLSG